MAVRAPVGSEPLSGSVPFQAPDATHAVALLLVQARFALWPAVSELGFAVIVMLGAVAARVTVVDCVAVPPGPVQVMMKFVVAVRIGVACEPLVGTLPLQPPDAVQVLASTEVQLSIVVMPAFNVEACAARLTEGAGAVTITSVDCDDAPPGPLQVSMNVVFAVSASIVADPLTGFDPLHPPLARQAFAPETFQERVVPVPLVTLLGLGCSLMTGPAAVVESVLELVLEPVLVLELMLVLELVLESPLELALLSELPTPWQAASAVKLTQAIATLRWRNKRRSGERSVPKRAGFGDFG